MTSFADRARMTAAPTRARAKRVRPSSPHVPRPPWAPVRLRADGAASLAVEAAPNRTGLPNGLKEGMEALSGLSMDDVRVHRNSSEPARLGALAFARGSDIHLGSGQEHHLPHEAWHVIQQKQGRVSPTAQALPGLAVNDDPALEREADLMGAHSLMRAPEPGPSKASPRAAPVQAGSTAQARVVQCWLDPALLAGRTRDNRTRALAQQALAYNSDRKGKTRAVRIDQLQELLATTLKWLDDSPSPDQNTSPAARWAKDLLNAVQDEHQGLVRLSIADQDALPPVANFAQLPRTEQDFVRRTWQELVQGTGNIRITETENYAVGGGGSRQHQGFRIEVLAQFARLLGTATGRDIVAQVNADTGGAKLVTVKPAYAQPVGGVPGSEFAAAPTVLTGADKLTEVDVAARFKGVPDARRKRALYVRKFVELDLSRIPDPKAKAAAIYAARRANPNAIGLKTAGKYYLFGAGTAVDVTVTRDIRDSADHHTSRLVDAARNEIAAPNFITLGHELGHAAHMMKGVALGEQATSDHLLGQVGVTGAELGNWSNMEEYANIHSVENALRADYGMKPRFGHINQAAVQRQRLDAVINRFYSLSDLQPVPLRGPVEQDLGRAGTATASLKIGDARIALADAANSFLAQMPISFPQFTPNETAAIQRHLTEVARQVASAQEDVLKSAEQNLDAAALLVTNANARVNAIPVAPAPKPSFFWRMLGY